MIKLYQFPISHYCEKARWALEHKKLAYKKINLLPGLHVKKAIKLAGKPYLPILEDQGNIINESRKIITYLDNTYPDNPLTPKDHKLKDEASMWELFADKELGPDVRGLCYHTLLNHPDITIPFFTKDGPWYGHFILKYMFPKLSIKMRELMKLDEKNVSLIRQRLTKAIDKLHQRTKNRDYLVGNSFSRADLAVASLLAPLCRPKKYGLDWPDQYPEPLNSTIREFGDTLSWVQQVYQRHR